MITPSLPAGRFAVQGINAKMQSNKVKALNSFARAVAVKFVRRAFAKTSMPTNGFRQRELLPDSRELQVDADAITAGASRVAARSNFACLSRVPRQV